MKRTLIGFAIASFLLTGLTACFSTSIEKPDQLISKNKFVKMMTDIYLVEGLPDKIKDTSLVRQINSTDLYYSVLKKYEVTDSVFIRSLLYYNSFPKEYERMHNQIMAILNETDQQFKPNEKLNTPME